MVFSKHLNKHSNKMVEVTAANSETDKFIFTHHAPNVKQITERLSEILNKNK